MDLVESYRDDLRFLRRPVTRAVVLTLLAVLVLLPAVVSEHHVYVLTLIALTAIGTIGQNFLIGFAGQISFGQAGFLAIGAYAFGHLRVAGAPFLVALAAAGVAAGLAGVAIGFPSLRLKGPYLAIATLGFGVAVYQVFVNWEVLSGGRAGLSLARLEPLLGMSRAVTVYYWYLLLLVASTLAAYNVVSSYLGRALVAIRDSEIAAEVTGVNLTRYKLFAFGLSSFYTGVQGALLAQLLGHLEPQMFTLAESITLFVAVIVGGVASIEGALLGATFVVLVPQLFAASREFVPVVFGATILLVLIFEPRGFAGGLWKLRLYFAMWPFR
jgi:branched-chain amino acid transport system permease protein